MVTAPSPTTLKKYGLSEAEWRAILERQGGVCYVCKKVPSTGRFNTDHEHVSGWKKMPPERRKLFVRGLLCFFCNRYYLARAITVEKSRNVTAYLLEYQERRPKDVK